MKQTHISTHTPEAIVSTIDTSVIPGNLAVIGMGYVGLPLAITAERRGYRVRGFDIDDVKVAFLKERDANYLNEKDLAYFSRSAMDISTDEGVLRRAEIIAVTVPTPVHESSHTPDLRPLQSACAAVGRTVSRGALVIVESTVNPGACEKVALPIIERISGLSAGVDFGFAHAPERVNPGDEKYSVSNIPRVVGAIDEESLERTIAFYREIIDAEIMPMGSIKEAEAVKMVENSFRDINIAFVNELALSFERAGIDIVNVIKGASTKPFGFMAFFPSCGVGGHCIPVDPYYLIHYGIENGFKHRFLALARRINSGMPIHTVDRLEEALSLHKLKIKNTHVALLGLTYKRDIPDLRESPGLAIKEELLERGATVKTFDPYAPRESSATSLDEALEGSQAVIVAVDHHAFREITPNTLNAHGIKVLVDGKNFLPKHTFEEAGISYRGIGR